MAKLNKATLSNWSSKLLMLFGLVLGLYFFSFNVIGFNFEYFPGDLGDGRLNLYFLEHAYKFFTGNLDSFWDAPFMYPQENVLAFSDTLLGSAPIYSFFRLFGMDTFLAYQWWFILVSSLNYISAFYFLKYVFKDSKSAVLGAYVFAFSIALYSQISHAQTFPRFAIPLALLMAVKFSEGLNPKYFFYTLLLLVYQIFCGIYLGFMLSIPIGIYLILVLIREKLKLTKITLNKNWYLKILASVVLCISMLLPLMIPYFERKISPNFQHFKVISHSLPTFSSFFYSHKDSLVWSFLSEVGQFHKDWWNHQIFVGGITNVCAIICGVLWIKYLIKNKFKLAQSSNTKLLLLTGIITFLLFLRFQNVSLYLLVYYLPGFSAMRSLTRVINIELIFYALSVAFVFSRFLSYRKKNKMFFFIIGVAILVMDNYSLSFPNTEVKSAKTRTKSVENAFASVPSGSIVSYEPVDVESQSFYFHIDAMLLAQKYNLKTINGYTATCPSEFGPYWGNPNEENRLFWLEKSQQQIDSLFIVENNNSVLLKK